MEEGEVPVGEAVPHLLPGAGDADAAVQHGAAQGRRTSYCHLAGRQSKLTMTVTSSGGSIYRSENHIFLPLTSEDCSETTLTGESRFHISTPQGI
jgi:hypothetical protein